MKKRLLAVLMALCITSLETMGAYAAVAENGETSQIAVEESEENTEDSGESAEDLSDSSETQENNTENSGEDGPENVPDQNGENSQDEDSSEENTTESEDDINQQDPNVEEEDEQEEELSEISNEGITDKETAAIEEPKEADNAESSDAVMSGECGAEGDNLTWELSGTETDLTLTIRGSGQMASYATYRVLAPWHKSAANIKNIVLSEEMTSIGNEAFSFCSNMTCISIPEKVTSIGAGAFRACSSLSSVTFSEGVTSIGDEAFFNCSSLTSVTIPEGVTSIGDYAFSGCSSLTSVTIPKEVTSIGKEAFYRCQKLSEIYVCSLESWLKLSVDSGDPYLYGEIYINGELLTNAIIPEGMTNIRNYAFAGCSSLTNVTIPEGVTSIGNSAFSRCSSLTSVTIPEGVTSIGNSAFSRCSSLTSVTIPEGVTSISPSTFYECSSLSSVIIPESVTSIENQAFSGCSSLTNVTIPEGVKSIKGGTFSGCSNLACITIPEGVTSIGDSAFSRCSSLTSVTIPEGVTSISPSTFYECSSLSSIIIPESVTSIEYKAFSGCSSLTNVLIPEGVRFIGEYAFYYCRNLASVTIPERVRSIGDSAFCNCSSLASVAIPEGVTYIGNNAFKNCWSLASVTIPEGVISIGGSVFNGCFKLKNVCIPYSTERISSAAFSNYSGKVYYWGTRDELEKIYNGDKEIELISIFLDKDMLNLENNQSTTLFITSNYEDIGNDIIWSSSDNEIVSVSETGIVTANNIGEAIITAATRWGDHTASCMVSVVVPVTGILLEQEQVELSSGSSKQLIVVIEPDDATNKEVTWTSSNPEIVSVDEDGIITAHSGGTATITAVTKDGQFSADCTVTVPVPVESVSLDKSEMLLKADEACSLNATVLPEDAAVKELIWTSSDESVVTVDDGGTVTAHSPGSAIITVTTVDGNKTDECVVTVPAPVPVSGVELEHDSITVDIDTEVELKAIVYPEDAANKNLIWSSSDESIASINSNGVLQAKEFGVAEITVMTEDGSYTATCQVSVIIPVSEIILDKYSIQLEKGQNEKITVEILPENAADTIITWKSSDTKVATVDETGIVTATGGGTSVITASTSNGKTAQCEVKVSFTYSSINYILNGGDNNPDNPEQYNELGISEFKEPTRSGYIFKGWYADEQLTEKVTGIEAGQTGDLTIYAKWTGKTYNIVFNGNSADSGKMSKISYTIGKTASLPGNTFKKKECVFNGWNRKANGKGTGFKNKGSLGSYDAANGSTITLYAQWKLKDYSIVYKLNGGVNNKSNPATYNFKTAVTALAKPTRKGYLFQGWFTDAKFKNPFKGIKKGSSGNKTVYAKWAAIKYTVSYTLNGGKAPTVNVKPRAFLECFTCGIL